MTFITKEFQKIAVKSESTEGVYQAPTNSDFLEVTEDGLDMAKTRESLERKLLTGNRVTKKTRLSNKDVEVSFSSELTANKTEGQAPAFSELLESFGLKGTTSAEDTVLATSTASVLKVADASIYAVGDIVKVKEPNNNHISPISEVDLINDTITLKIAMSSAPTDGTKLAAKTQYKLDSTINKTLSVTRFFQGDELQERATGCRTSSISLQNFSVGQIPVLAFSLMGLTFTDILEPSSFIPDYQNAEPAYVHLACMYKDATKINVSEIGLSMEQTVSKIKTTCSENGSIASRGTGEFNIQVTFNPYKEQNSLGFVLDDSTYSLFFSIFNPTNADNTENANAVAFNIPKVKTTQSALADVDGVHTDSVTAQAVPESESESIVIAFF